MKLTPDQRRELLNEMELAALFTEKRWAARFSISVATVRRLRREARERRERLLPNLAHEIHVVCFATGSKGATKA